MPTPRLGVCYYPEHWPEEMWAQDAADMAALGLSRVRIGEFAWSRMEPARGRFAFDWLDRAIAVLGEAGLGVIMCTPTATPPKWLVDEIPDMVPADEHGRPRNWGSRRHYDFSHEGYLAEAKRITQIVAERYGANEHVVAWQTDNEYGCHDTTLSWSAAARDGFRDWLAERYGSPDALNRAWGNVFWSMEIASFSEIELPNLTVTESNPAHHLAFRRYASSKVRDFNRAQVAIIRRHSPGRDVTHNLMGMEFGFDHFDVGEDLDLATWDSYPLGFLERHATDPNWRNWYLRAGDPDFQAFHHDLYRACGRGRWGVMEQQPGPVNWAPWNPAPHRGMIRLWTHEAVAHGAELVSYFRWRQAPWAQEQFHAGLCRPDGTPDEAATEVRAVAKELAALGEVETERAPVALVFDYVSHWAVGIQPQGRDFDPFTLVFTYYRALRRLGLDVDIVRPGASLEGYRMVVVPLLVIVSDEALAALEDFDGPILLGARSGSRTTDHAIPEGLAPGRLRALIDVTVERVESLPPRAGEFRWREFTRGQAKAERSQSDGVATLLRDGRTRYLTVWPDDTLLRDVIETMADEAGIATLDLHEDVRVRDLGPLRFFFNYGPKPARIMDGATGEFVIGGRELDVAGVAVVRLA